MTVMDTELDADREALFNRIADGLATEADEQRLAELLSASAEARRAYREFMALHSALHWDCAAAALPGIAAAPVSPAGGPVQASRLGWFVAFMAGVVVASVVGLAVLRPNWSPVVEKQNPEPNAGRLVATPVDDVKPKAVQAEPIAALLVDEAGAKFAEGRGPDGVRFGPGEYELLQGVVHLRFAQGADMVLASPARWAVKDAQHTRLAFGKVRVVAPPTAKGFTIATRGADYVDLGTEFGLRVDRQSGTSDLYVFDGQVNVTDPQSGKVLSQVAEGNSSRYTEGRSGTAPELLENDFPTPGTIGFERWQQYAEELRRSPGLVAFFPFRRSPDDALLVNGCEKSDMVAGRIVGPRWVSGRWPGKDSLLFDRDDDYVQLDIPGEHQELTIAVWLKVERLDFELNAILNSDEFDPGDMHFQLTRQGLPRGGVVVVGGFRERVVGNKVPIGNWTHVVSVLSVPNRLQTIYVNGVVARERELRGSEVIRPGSCRLGNWLSDAKAGLASRAFRGRMDELAIWNRALSADEVKQLVEAGRPGLLWGEE